MRPREKSGVYVIQQLGTERTYIGSSTRLSHRWSEHRRLLECGQHHSPFLQNAWNVHGRDAFEFRILEECEATKATLLEREQEYLDAFNPVFNVCRKAGSRLGAPFTAEQRARLSSLRKQMLADGRAKPPPASTPETQAKAALARIGRVVSAETRAKSSASQKGRTLTAEHRAKLSAAHKGVPLSESHKAGLRAARAKKS